MLGKKQGRNGKRESKPIEKNSKKPSLEEPSEELIRKLEAVYDHFNSGRKTKLHEQRKHWFVFHMTDWLSDYQKLEQLYSHPDQVDGKQAKDTVAGILFHAVQHLLAASRLCLDYEPKDIFMELEAQLEADLKKKTPRRK